MAMRPYGDHYERVMDEEPSLKKFRPPEKSRERSCFVVDTSDTKTQRGVHESGGGPVKIVAASK